MRLGSICASQRRPYCTVRVRLGCHLSCTKTAGSFCGIDCVPASSTESPPTPACCRYRSTGPLMELPAGQEPVSEVVRCDHSTNRGLRAQSEKASGEAKMQRRCAKPADVCTELTR